VPSSLTDQDPTTRIPDIRDRPLGERADERRSGNAVILKRVLQNKSVEVPVAAFQSSI
jgi:hypothetical protein